MLGLDFSAALNQLKNGEKLQRLGWSGRGMYIVLQKGYPHGIPINANTAEATGLPEGTKCAFLPYIMMKTATSEVRDGEILNTFVPWLASQTDILAEDWVTVAHR